MGLYLGQEGAPDPVVLSVADSGESVSQANASNAAVGASALYPSAALGLFVPVRINQRRTYVRAFWVNGTAVAGNIDVGVYTIAGATATRLQSIGSTAQAGTTAIQTVTISWTFDPGLYYLGFSSSDATTAQFMSTNAAAVNWRQTACFESATQSPLASTPTVVAYARAYMPYFGIAEQAI